jgi:ABC-type phosphate transport system auxiliary subunit
VSEQNQSRELKKAVYEVNSLRKDVDDIKNMLITLINGTNKNG